MLRFLGIGAIAYLSILDKLPAFAADASGLLGQPEFVAGTLIALLLIPTIKRSFE